MTDLTAPIPTGTGSCGCGSPSAGTSDNPTHLYLVTPAAAGADYTGYSPDDEPGLIELCDLCAGEYDFTDDDYELLV